MNQKKLLAAALACCMAAAPVISTSAFAADDAAAPGLVFDITSGKSNEITLTTDDLAGADYSIPIEIYVPSNPGVNGIGLKLQIGDGQVSEDGSFGNYGFRMENAKFGGVNSGFCFDSENKGDASKAFTAIISEKYMNIGWVYRYEQTANADAVSEPGTTSWTSDTSWAYDNAFVSFTLVVPKDAPVDDYVLDVRRDKYVNHLASSQTTTNYSITAITHAEDLKRLEYDTKPFTIHVIEPPTTTTTSETTTTEPATTTEDITTSEAPADTTLPAETTTSEAPADTTLPAETTTSEAPANTTISSETTTSEAPADTAETNPVTTDETAAVTGDNTEPPLLPVWKDDYSTLDDGMYLVIDQVCGKPGDNVKIPVYLYNPTDVAGMRLFFTYPEDITLRSIVQDFNDPAYMVTPKISAETNPASVVFVSSNGLNLEVKGTILFEIRMTIPKDAVPGTVYDFEFYTADSQKQIENQSYCQIADQNGTPSDVKFFAGSVTVTEDDSARISRSSVSLSKIGETADLTLFHARGDVEWKSTDESVATVDPKNGVVTATGFGSCTVVATTSDGKNYTASVTVGLYGDINCDGTPDVKDALMVLINFNMVEVLGEDPILTDAQLQIADVDKNGAVNTVDAMYILKYTQFRYVLCEDIVWYDLIPKDGVPTTLQGEVDD